MSSNPRPAFSERSAPAVAHRSIAAVPTPQTCCASGWGFSTMTLSVARWPTSLSVQKLRGSRLQMAYRSSRKVPLNMRKSWLRSPSLSEERSSKL